MSELEKKLLETLNDLTKKNAFMANFYWSRFKKELENAKAEEYTDSVRKLLLRAFITFFYKNKEVCEEYETGKSIMRSKAINELETNLKEISELIEGKFSREELSEIDEISGINFIAKTKEYIKEAKKLISLGKEFATLDDKLKNLKNDEENFSWLAVKKLWNEVKEKAASEKYLTDTAQSQKWNFLGEIAEGCWGIAEMVKEGEKNDIPPNAFPSTAEELDFFQEIADGVPKAFDWFLKTQKEDRDKEVKIREEIKTRNEELKTFIQQERKKLGSSQPPKKPNPQEEQKIQTQQKEIETLKKQLAELQNQIEDMKKNKANLTDQNAGQEVIEKLEEKKQEIQTKLEQKQSSQKRLKNKVNSQQNNSQPEKFNWLYVVIPGGVLLFVIGIVIAYLLGKKNK